MVFLSNYFIGPNPWKESSAVKCESSEWVEVKSKVEIEMQSGWIEKKQYNDTPQLMVLWEAHDRFLCMGILVATHGHIKLMDAVFSPWWGCISNIKRGNHQL